MFSLHNLRQTVSPLIYIVANLDEHGSIGYMRETLYT